MPEEKIAHRKWISRLQLLLLMLSLCCVALTTHSIWLSSRLLKAEAELASLQNKVSSSEGRYSRLHSKELRTERIAVDLGEAILESGELVEGFYQLELCLRDKETNVPRAALSIYRDDKGRLESFQMFDEVGRSRISASIQPDGNPRLELLDQNAKPCLRLAVGHEPRLLLSLFNEAGIPCAAYRLTKDGRVSINR